MLIGEICKLTNLSKDTIRYYEKRGLLHVEKSESAFNNYKNYTAENLQRLFFIKRAKNFGFTLNEIIELCEMQETGSANCSTISKKVFEKIAAIDQRIKDLQDMKAQILKNVEIAEMKCRPSDGKCMVLLN